MKNMGGLDLKSTCLVVQDTNANNNEPSTTKSAEIVTQDFQTRSTSYLRNCSIAFSRKNLKPNPPLLFAVSEPLLKWINEYKPPKIKIDLFVDKKLCPNKEIEKACVLSANSSSVFQENSSLYQISKNLTNSNSLHKVINFFNSLNHGSIGFYLSDFNEILLDKINNQLPNIHSSEISDATLKFNPCNLVIPKFQYVETEPLNSSGIDGEVEDYKTSRKIWMDEVTIESDDKYFYIYSQPTPPTRYMLGSNRYFAHT
ncbi:hypothetical protein MXB_4487 [Myxobolus squamalis]|nr:hypothetical protein MXB_4487 [Myxobolus squamalis]